MRWVLTAALVIACAAVAPGAGACAGPCSAADYDGDGVNDWADNCPVAGNPTQRDADKDTPPPVVAVGRPEGAPNTPVLSFDNGIQVYPETPYQTAQPLPSDMPRDKGGDACDDDDDNDGVNDRGTAARAPDNCRLVANPDQKDTDGDGAGDACDETPGGAPAGGPVAQPAVSPRIRASAPRRLRFDDVGSALIVPLRCSARCRVAGQLVLDRKSARQGRLGRGKRSVVLGKGSAFLDGAGSTYLFVEIPRTSVERLARAFRRIRPLLRVTAPGAGVVLQRRLTLRR